MWPKPEVTANRQNFPVCAGMKLGLKPFKNFYFLLKSMGPSDRTANQPDDSPAPPARTLRARGRRLPGGPRPRERASPGSPRLGPPRHRPPRGLARAPPPWAAPMLRGKRLESCAGKGPPARAHSLPAKVAGPRRPAGASLLPAEREARVRRTPPGPGPRGGAETARDANPTQQLPASLPRPLRSGEGGGTAGLAGARPSLRAPPTPHPCF